MGGGPTLLPLTSVGRISRVGPAETIGLVNPQIHMSTMDWQPTALPWLRRHARDRSHGRLNDSSRLAPVSLAHRSSVRVCRGARTSAARRPAWRAGGSVRRSTAASPGRRCPHSGGAGLHRGADALMLVRGRRFPRIASPGLQATNPTAGPSPPRNRIGWSTSGWKALAIWRVLRRLWSRISDTTRHRS